MSLVLHNPQGVWWCRRVIRVFRVFGKEANAAFALPLLLPVKEMGDGPIRADPAAERIQRNCTVRCSRQCSLVRDRPSSPLAAPRLCPPHLTPFAFRPPLPTPPFVVLILPLSPSAPLLLFLNLSIAPPPCPPPPLCPPLRRRSYQQMARDESCIPMRSTFNKTSSAFVWRGDVEKGCMK